MKLPWTKKAEHRNYTDALIAAAFAQASGEVVAGLSASLEIAAGWWQRAFQSIDIQPAGIVSDLVNPHLGAIGRALVARGEIVFAIDADGESLALLPASEYDVSGGPNPASWSYRLTLTGPTETVTRTYQPDRVLHLMYAPSARSWKGVSPIMQSETTKTLLNNMEQRLGEEVGAGVGNVIPVPNKESVATLQAELRALGGKLALVETTAKGYGEGQQGIPTGDFQPRRLGGNPPESTVTLRRQVEESILAAAGVPSSILAGDSDTAAREGLKRFVYTVIDPVATRLAEVVGAQFGIPELTFGIDRLRSIFLQERSRAFGTLVQGGMSVEDAAVKTLFVDA